MVDKLTLSVKKTCKEGLGQVIFIIKIFIYLAAKIRIFDNIINHDILICYLIFGTKTAEFVTVGPLLFF